MLKKVFIGITLIAVILGALIAYYLSSLGYLRAPHYNTERPDIPVLQHPAILVLSKTNGFIHKEGLPAGGKMLEALAVENGWHLYATENAASHNSEDLARFDVVIWNNTSGDILTEQQRKAFKSWMLDGGQWLGLHAAGGDPEYEWDWFPDSLIGAQFFGHTMSPQFQDADVLVVDASSLTSHLAKPWRVKQEEWYAFDRNPRDTGSKILLALDEASYSQKESWVFPKPSMPGEHPIAWTHSLGQGTVIYSALGHTAETYSNPDYRTFITKSIDQLLSH